MNKKPKKIDKENIKDDNEVEEQPQEAEQAPQPKENVPKGVFLRQTREKQGLSLEAVHEATKVPMDALRAIEEGYTIRTLSPFYIKGFLKIYATYLGLDVSEVIDDYKKEELPQPIRRDSNDFEVQQWMVGFFTRERKRQLFYLIGIILALFFIFKVITFFTHKKPDASSSKRVEQVKKSDAQKSIFFQKKSTAGKPKPDPKVEPKVEVPKVMPMPAVSSQSVRKNVTLTVRAKKRSWLRVKTDAQIVFQSTLNAGSVETWMADDKIEITGRNINQLEFELNGKLIGTLGRKDRRAKGVVVTKDGLSVIK